MNTYADEETPPAHATDDVTDHVKSFFRYHADSEDGEHYVCYLGIGLKAEGAKEPSRMIYLSWEGTDPYAFYEGAAPPDRPELTVPHASLADYTLFEDFLAAVRARHTLTPAQACGLLAGLGYADATEVFVTAVAPRYCGCNYARFRLRIDVTGLFTDCSVYDSKQKAEVWEELLPTPKLTRVDGGLTHTLTIAYVRPELGSSHFGVIVRDAAGAFVEVRRLDNTAVDEFNDARDWYECLSVPRCVYHAVLYGFATGTARVVEPSDGDGAQDGPPYREGDRVTIVRGMDDNDLHDQLIGLDGTVQGLADEEHQGETDWTFDVLVDGEGSEPYQLTSFQLKHCEARAEGGGEVAA